VRRLRESLPRAPASSQAPLPPSRCLSARRSEHYGEYLDFIVFNGRTSNLMAIHSRQEKMHKNAGPCTGKNSVIVCSVLRWKMVNWCF
jgi:hypothetical protein